MAVTVEALRRYVVAHQRFTSRFRRADADAVGAEIGRLQAVQLDSIATVDRAHRLTLTSRVGAYEEPDVSRLLAAGRVFEYWAHEACLLSIHDYPLMKRRMEHLRHRHWWGRERTKDLRAVEREVLARIREEGGLPARAFEGRGDPGSMWSWKPAKRALEHLFAAGEVAISGRQGFQRVYDLPERVIPRAALEAPVPAEDEFRRGYALRAVQGRGALTESGIAEHCRFEGGAKAMRPLVDALVADGLVRRLEVADGGAPVVVPADAELDGASPSGAVLLSPFDNLLWDRAFAKRLFGFEHVIEVYKREHERIYGYYVLPLLVGDRFVGRADLKAERAEGVLRIRKFTPEPEVGRRLHEMLERAATRLARSIGLERVERA